MAQGATLPPLSLPSMSGLLAWLHSSPLHLPRQTGGSASGLAHTASTASTRAEGGRGRKPGKGKGQLPAYKRHVRSGGTFTTGPAVVRGHDGFKASTSKRVASQSSATEDVFRNADGTTTRRLYTSRHNFRAADGSWMPIDTSMVKAPSGRLTERANDLAVDFAARAGDAALASIGLDASHQLSYSLDGAADVPATVDADGTVTYAGALPGTDLELVPLADGVKEKLLLNSADAPTSWSFTLKGKGLTPRLAGDGSVEFTDARGKVTERIPHAFMQDASVDPKSGEHATSHAVQYSLARKNGHWVLTMKAGASWVADSRRVWPITVDPTVTDGADTYAETGNSGDHSTEDVLKVGSYNSGTNSANSFLHFTNLDSTISGQNVTAASLHVFDIWASTCTAEPFYVSPVSAAWTASAVTSYPGPAWDDVLLGSVTTSPGAACTNSGGSRTTGVWMTVPLDDSWFDGVSLGTKNNYGLSLYSTTTDALHWKQFDSYNVASTSYRPYLDLTYVANTPPQIDTQNPPDNYNTSTLKPELIAYGSDADGFPGTALKYQFQVLNATTSAVVSDSGLISKGDWQVPSGKLTWANTYVWQVRAYDGKAYSPWEQSSLATTVPQPPVTSNLSQNTDGHDFDPSVGNYTTSDTDADVQTVGPSLSIDREYNSLDPRTDGAFGAGWSTVADMEAAEVKDSTGAVTSVNITYPDGSQVGFGRNADGSFAPPPGRFATLTATTSPAGYKLVDKDDTAYLFQQPITGRTGAYAVSGITDYAGRAETFTYTGGQLTKIVSAVSGRTLALTWSTPSGATAPHVATVATDPATTGDSSTVETWQYAYTGDSLTKVCPPADATHCTTYVYQAGSHYRTTVLDADPLAYWRLGEASGTAAGDAVDVNEGKLNGTYHNVTLGSAGPLAGSKAATFNGTSSYVSIPSSAGATPSYVTASLWFKTTQAGGVLFYYGDKPLTDSDPVAHTKYNTPALYIGSNGKLHGCFAMAGGCYTPIQSSGTVTNGAWHQAVLTGAGNTQSMYLDGALVGSMSGEILDWNQPYVTFGAGVDTHGWPDMPADTLGHFNGQIAEASLFTQPLPLSVINQQYKAATTGAQLLKTITLPSGKTENSVTYNAVDDTISQETDNNGGVWKLQPPTVTGSSQVYHSAVMGAGPAGYWRLADTAAAQAVNEVHTGYGTYNNVTLGAAGPFGAGDATAATFNGTSSYVEVPSSLMHATADRTVELWFKTASPGVLIGDQGSPIAGTTTSSGGWTPVLYVGSDGKLHGHFYSVSGSGSTAFSSTAAVNNNVWHHAVLSVTGTTQTMYVDGVQQAAFTGAPNDQSNVHTYIGAGFAKGWYDTPGDVSWFNGSIAEAAFFHQGLTAAQVAQQWTAYKSSSGIAPVRTVKLQVPTQDGSTKYVTYGYDVQNGDRVLSSTDALGNRTTYGYDTSGFLYTVTDPDGNTTTTGHDVRGNVVSKTTCQNQAANACSTEYYTYYPDDTTAQPTPDPRNDLLLTERDGRSSGPTDNHYLTTYSYDAYGNQTGVTTPPVPGFPNGRTTSTTYTTATTPAADSGYAPAYLLASTVTPGGARQTYTYNHNGDLAQQVDPSGGTAKLTYDNIGRLLTRTAISDSYPAGLVTSYTYDKDDQVTSETDPPVTDRITGAVHTQQTVTARDVDGNPTSETISDLTGGDGKRRTEWTYDTANRVATESQVAAFNADGSDKTLQTTTYGYDVYGNTVKEVDPAGGETDYTFDADSRQLTTTQPGFTGDPDNPSAARTLTLDSRSYDPAGRVASVTDSMGWTTSSTYTDNGLLATVTRTDAVTDPQHPKSFVQQVNTYDAAGNMVQQVTNDGATTTDFTVDAASRTTSTTLDPAGLARTTTVSYDPDDHVVTSTRTGASGAPETTTSTYDALGNPTSSTVHDTTTAPVGRWKLNETSGTTAADSSGSTRTGALQGGATWSTENGGSAVFNGTDAAVSTDGPVVDTTGSFSVSAWVKVSAAAKNYTAVAQDANWHSGFYLGYEHSTNKWAIRSPDKDYSGGSASAQGVYSTATAVQNQWTHLTAVFDQQAGTIALYVNGALQGTTPRTYTIGSHGPLQIGRALYAGAYTDYFPGGISDVQVYSSALSASQVSSVYAGTQPVAGSTVHTTRQHLDQRGLATWSADENGNITSYGYDEAGQLAVVTAPTVNAETVDPSTGTSSVAAAHPVSYTGYNTFGEVAESKDPNGNVTTSAYDPLGQQTSTTLPSYTPPGSSVPITPVTSTEYNSAGQITAEIDALNNRTTYVYDQLGDQVDVTEPGGRTTHTTFDTNGDQLSATDPTGATTQATYDYLGHQLTSTQVERKPSQAAYTTVNHYDASGGWLSSSVSPTGVTTSIQYDAAGEQTTVVDGAGNPTTYTYDLDGRQTKVTNPDQTASTATYDAFGNQTGTADLDATGMVRRTTSSQYDAAGNLVSATDGNGHTTTFTVDPTGLVTKEVQPVSASESITTSFGYDMAGNRTRFTDGRGFDASGAPVAGHDFLTTYNPWNLPERQIEPSTPAYPAVADRTFTAVYDANGQVAQQLSPGGVQITNSYDEVGDLTKQTGTGAEVATADHSFGYDAAGRMTSAAAPGADDTFSYDDRGNLLSAGGPSGSSSFAYTGDGQMSSRTDAAGTSSYGYDTAGRLKTINDAASGSAATVSYNTMSLPTQISYGAGKATRTLGYDSLHRLTSDVLANPSGSTEASIAYGYDLNDNETSKTTTGVAGASANTYTYDWADRLTSWNNGTTAVAYSYDASGNRTRVGGDTYTYDARNELTSDGHSTYAYTARGTLRSTTDELGKNTATAADAFNRVINAGGQTYTYDGLDRVVTAGDGVSNQTFAYTGTGNDLASDGQNSYGRDPSGALVGINAGGTKVLAMTDLHDDVVGQFTDGGSALTGSTTYDPFGKITATSGMLGQLGYQSEWTDPNTSQVDMAARWYNPNTGQFNSRDTVGLNPVPDSVNADRFAYANDNPLTVTDPTGHWGWSSFTHAVSSAWHATTSAVSSAWNYTSSYASSSWYDSMSYMRSAYHAAATVAKKVVHTVKHYAKKVVHRINDARRYVVHYVKHVYHRVRHYVHHAIKKAKHFVHSAVKAVKHAAKAIGRTVKKAAKAAAKFVKKHAATIASVATGVAVFAGCAATAGVATFGVGMVGCAALAGAASNAVGYAMANKGHITAGGLLASAAIGAVSGAVGAAAGGALGEVVTPMVSEAVSGLSATAGRVVGGAVTGAVSGAAGGAASGAADYAGGCATGGDCSLGGAVHAVASGAESGAVAGGVLGAAGGLKKGAGCGGPHSFTATTGVLLAAGLSKPISQVKVGDLVLTAAPGDKKKERHRVDRVIVTKTDHDFVDVTVATKTGSQTIHTTKHHQFYDATTNSWTQAANLKAHDKLQNASGGTTEIVSTRIYTATQTTYDLTINGLHTYYVEAGSTPVLVHNCGGGDPDHADNCLCGTNGPTRLAVTPGEVGSFKDLNSRSRVGDGLTPDHIPQAASNRLPNRGDYASVMLTDAEHALTRDFKGAGIRTKRVDAPLTFRQVVAAKLWNYRSIGQQLYNDPSYFNEQITGVLNFYRTNYPGLLDRPAPGATGEWGR